MDDKASEITKDSNDFWILVAALKAFMDKEGNGFLPVSTNIPDMTSEPKHFVTLKQMYADFVFFFFLFSILLTL
jgi:amyloid beta precursor protein binding protein 1